MQQQSAMQQQSMTMTMTGTATQHVPFAPLARWLALALGVAGMLVGASDVRAQPAVDNTETVILAPAGKDIKPRYLERIARSLEKGTKGTAGVKHAGKDGGQITGGDGVACAADAACIGAAGTSLGAARVIGVLVEPAGKDYKLTFVLVDVASQTEVARKTEDLKKDDLRKTPGPLLSGFMASAPAPAAATGDDAAATGVDDTATGVDDAATGDDDAATGDDAAATGDDAAATGDDAAATGLDDAATGVDDTATGPGDDGADTATGVDDMATGVDITATGVGNATSGVDAAGKKIHVGIHVGVVLPQLQSELGTAPGFEVEGGYRVWKNLSPLIGVAYTQPTVAHEAMDPRLDNVYMTDTTQRELTITVGALWRFLPADSAINAYAGLGARIWLLETITNGSAGGAEFLENRETSTRVGATLQVGGEYGLGPGAATAELDLGGSDLPHLVTGDVATTAISASVGYRLLF